MVKNVVARLYHSLIKVEPMRLYSHDAAGFRDDLGIMQLRRLLLEVLERTDDAEARLGIVRLLMRWGVTRASSEDLLLASKL